VVLIWGLFVRKNTTTSVNTQAGLLIIIVLADESSGYRALDERYYEMEVPTPIHTPYPFEADLPVIEKHSVMMGG
jgi:hypothetical protein